MPVSVYRDPFASAPPARGVGRLLTPQARVLAALVPPYPEDPVSEWPMLTRPQLGVCAGYSAISGTVTRALHGITRKCKSGDPHLGVIGLGLVEEVVVEVIDGMREVNYRITIAGVQALRTHVAASGGHLPRVRDAKASTNNRYRNTPQ